VGGDGGQPGDDGRVAGGGGRITGADDGGQPGDSGGQVGNGAEVGGGQRRVGCQAAAVGRSVAVRRWATAACSRAAPRRWVAVATAGCCGSPRDEVVVVVLSLCGHGYQNETSQRANLLLSMLGCSKLL
jgi:hypothetical protein